MPEEPIKKKKACKKRKLPKRSRKPPPRPTGAPTLYRPAMNELAYNYALLGAVDRQISEYLGVKLDIYYDWRNRHAAFDEAIAAGKDEADAKVARSLFARANGYSHEDTHVSNFQGEVTLTPIVKQYPPDTAAAMFWLKNRQPELWKEKKEQHHTGNLSINQMLDEIDGTDTGLPQPLEGEYVEIDEDQERLEHNG